MTNLSRVGGKYIVKEMWSRVIERSAFLGIEPPPIINEVSRLLNENHPTWAQGDRTPDWLLEDLKTFMYYTAKFFRTHAQ